MGAEVIAEGNEGNVIVRFGKKYTSQAKLARKLAKRVGIFLPR